MPSDNVTPLKSDGDVLTHTDWNQHIHSAMTSGVNLWNTIATGTGAVDVTSIASGYKLFRLELFTSTPGTTTPITMRLNNDGDANYTSQTATFAGVVSTIQQGMGESSLRLSQTGGSGTRVFYVIDIVNISSSVKMIVGNASILGSVTDAQSLFFAGTWNNTSNEINRITVLGDTPIYWILFGLVQ
jgi:hypothetical protein